MTGGGCPPGPDIVGFAAVEAEACQGVVAIGHLKSFAQCFFDSELRRKLRAQRVLLLNADGTIDTSAFDSRRPGHSAAVTTHSGVFNNDFMTRMDNVLDRVIEKYRIV